MPTNIDLKHIQKVYANMLDEELLALARQEGLAITADAFLILRAELKKRGIGAELLRELEYEIMFQDALRRRDFELDADAGLFTEAVDYSLTKKEEGASNYEIYAGLIEKGVSEESSSYMVNKIDSAAEYLRKDAVEEMQAGLLTIGVGCIAILVAYKIDHFYMGAIMVFIIGFVRLIIGISKKHRSQKITEAVKAEEEKVNE